MFSTFSAISMPANEHPRRPVSWRLILSLILVLAAGGYLASRVPPVVRSYRANQRTEELTWAGVVAETLEQQIADDPAQLPQTCAAVLPPSFASNANLAYVRFWNITGRLDCEVTRIAPAQPSATGQLPDLGMQRAWPPVRERLARVAWVEPITQMQAVLSAQSELTATLDDALEQGEVKDVLFTTVYARQYEVQKLTGLLAQENPALKPVSGQMDLVLDGLTRKDRQALTQAAETSADIETALSQALEHYRAITADIPAFPAILASRAPAPATRWLGWWRTLRGRRVVVPLFTPDADLSRSSCAGIAEVAFYERPADLAAAIAGANLPAIGLLLAALLMLVVGRKPRTT